MGVAGATAHAAADPVPADERHARQCGRHRRQALRSERHPGRGCNRRRAATGAVELRIHARPDGKNRGTRLPQRRNPDLRGPLFAGRRIGDRASARLHRCIQQGTAPSHRRSHQRRQVHHSLRQDSAATAAHRCRHPSCRHAASLPPPGRTARPAGSAAGDLRHRYIGRRHQCADSLRGAHGPDQVRRHQDAPPARPRIPPDCRTSWPYGIRYRGTGDRRGSRI